MQQLWQMTAHCPNANSRLALALCVFCGRWADGCSRLVTRYSALNSIFLLDSCIGRSVFRQACTKYMLQTRQIRLVDMFFADLMVISALFNTLLIYEKTSSIYRCPADGRCFFRAKRYLLLHSLPASRAPRG